MTVSPDWWFLMIIIYHNHCALVRGYVVLLNVSEPEDRTPILRLILRPNVGCYYFHWLCDLLHFARFLFTSWFSILATSSTTYTHISTLIFIHIFTYRHILTLFFTIFKFTHIYRFISVYIHYYYIILFIIDFYLLPDEIL